MSTCFAALSRDESTDDQTYNCESASGQETAIRLTDSMIPTGHMHFKGEFSTAPSI